MRDGTGTIGRWTGGAVALAVVAGVAAQLLPPAGGPVPMTWILAVLLAAGAAGLLLRGLPASRTHLIAIVVGALLVDVALVDVVPLLVDGDLGAALAAGHVDLWGLLPSAAFLVSGAAALVGRDEPTAPDGPAASVAVAAGTIVAVAVWWTTQGGPLGMAPGVQPGWLVVGLGGAALADGPRRALVHVALVALLADPVNVLLAPLFGGMGEFAGQVALWGPAALLLALLLVLDDRRRRWEARPVEA